MNTSLQTEGALFDETQWRKMRNGYSQALAYARGTAPYYGWRKTLRFLLSAFARPSLYAAWFDYVERQLPDHSPLTGQNDMIGKPSLRYMRHWMEAEQKMSILRNHYNILNRTFSAAEQQRLQNSVTLAQLTGRSGRIYRLVLQSHMTKEGEFAFHFMDDALNTMLATIRGTLDIDDNGQRRLWIGSVQGPPLPHGREDVAAATRDLNALRPKQAVLQAVGFVCQWFGAHTICAPHKRDHISQGWWRNMLLRSKIHSDYDEFWEEFSAGNTLWGDYCLVLPFTRRSVEEVPSKRRKEWLLRYARIDAIGQGVTATLDAMRNGVPIN